MKRVFVILFTIVALFSLASCGSSKTTENNSEQPPAESLQESSDTNPVSFNPVTSATIPDFTIDVCGKSVTFEQLADYDVYEAQVHTINSSGTEATSTYVGFSLKDVFAAAGISEYESVVATADDGYFVEISKDVSLENTLIAISKDGNQYTSSPWFAPCSSGTASDYLKGMVAITLNGEPADLAALSAASNGDSSDNSDAAALPEISDRTDKVKFADYSFLVNGSEVTNSDLDGLHIYKISVSVVNSKGNASDATYTGYKLADVLTACGIENPTAVRAVANDGYTVELSAENIISDHTLVAIEKDKEVGEDGTIWIAPCAETDSGAYAKYVVEIIAE